MKDHRKERAEARKKAEKLVSQMTLLEKASQLKYDAAPVKRLGVPAYNYWNEALHGVARAGVATMFPQAIAMAAVFDDEEMKKVGDIIATEGRAKYNAYSAKEDRDIYKGLTFWSPNVNIFRDPRWGRGHETYGEDPYLTSRLGVKFVEGLQGDGSEFAAHTLERILQSPSMGTLQLVWRSVVDAGKLSVHGTLKRDYQVCYVRIK